MDKIALLALKKSGAVDVGLAVAAKEAAEAAQEAAETAQGKAEDAAEELEQTVEDVAELKTDVSNLLSQIKTYDIESSSFNLSLLNVDTDGYLYRNGTLPETHLNVAWCKKQRKINNIRTKVKFTSSQPTSTRFFFEDASGDVFWINIQIDINDNPFIAIYKWNMAVIVSAAALDITPVYDGENTININFVGDYVFVYINEKLVFYRNFGADRINIRNIVRVGYGWRGSGSNAYFKRMYFENQKKFVSISFDDQLSVLKTLTDNAESYTSLFECPGFDYLLQMHNKYGCKFTLMLFKQSDSSDPTFQLENTTTKFKNEFSENSSWLKFGYHGPDPTTYPSTMTVSSLIQDVQSVYQSIETFASYNNIDKVPRISFFNCTAEQALTMREDGLVIGFLTADDDRNSNTGLSGKYLDAVRVADYCADYEHDIRYFRTCRRLDDYAAESIIKNLNSQWNDPANNDMFIIFSHDFSETSMQEKLTSVIQWIEEHNIDYQYPMDVIL